MTTSVTFSCLGALVAFLLLACASGASAWARSEETIEAELASWNDSVELLHTTNSSETSEDSPRFNVTISDNDARALRQEMEAINDQLASNICRQLIPCGGDNLTANITKIKLNEQDIPSYFYEVKCPRKCMGNEVGFWFLDAVAVETIFFKKLDNDSHQDQYEVQRKSLIVGCYQKDIEVRESPMTYIPNPKRR